jgi:hypothetical protein
MNPFKKPAKSPGKQPGSDIPAKPPFPTLTTGETTLNDLPVLTEIVAEADPHLPRVLSAAEKQQLLHKLEKHIEILLSQKLALYLEQVQRVAIDQAIHELKTELPELLREALNAHLDSR